MSTHDLNEYWSITALPADRTGERGKRAYRSRATIWRRDISRCVGEEFGYGGANSTACRDAAANADQKALSMGRPTDWQDWPELARKDRLEGERLRKLASERRLAADDAGAAKLEERARSFEDCAEKWLAKPSA